MLDAVVEPSRKFRQALGTFATGVTVATTIDENGHPRGFTANSFTSVSLEPPLVLICIANDTAGFDVFTSAERFCINVLAENQQDISKVFALPGDDRFAGVAWRAGKCGMPVIDGVISWFDCERHEVVDAGDHSILIGRVVDYDVSSTSPLVYCSGSYVEFGLAQRAMEAASQGLATRISAVVDCDGAIPMKRDETSGKYSLPVAGRLGNRDTPDSLRGKLATNGIVSSIPFVYAVYEDTVAQTRNVVYRGSSENADMSRLSDFELVPLDDIPWNKLVDNSLGLLLERYCRERKSDAFGVYVGDEERGEVHALEANEGRR